jgi:hypothetical protein
MVDQSHRFLFAGTFNMTPQSWSSRCSASLFDGGEKSWEEATGFFQPILHIGLSHKLVTAKDLALIGKSVRSSVQISAMDL